jgi:flagellar basal-body rod protein FlgC
MDFNNAIKISASALSANRLYMNVLSANLANVNTTRTADGKPYQRRTVLYESVPAAETFDASLDGFMREDIQKVRVADVVSDGRDFKEIYDPSHPDANEQGVVLMPNISPIEEMANLVDATRSYEANLTALTTAKQLSLKALEIGR